MNIAEMYATTKLLEMHAHEAARTWRLAAADPDREIGRAGPSVPLEVFRPVTARD